MEQNNKNIFENLEDLGDAAADLVDKAVNSRNFQELSKSLEQKVNTVLGDPFEKQRASQRIRPDAFVSQRASDRIWARQGQTQMEQPVPIRKEVLYAPTIGEKVKGIVVTVGGLALANVFAGSMIFTGLLGAVFGSGLTFGVALSGIGLLAGVGLTVFGIKGIRRSDRFVKYQKILGDKTYCSFAELAQAVGKSEEFVKKDIAYMIRKGWFLQGHVDKQETCLMTSNESYTQYSKAQEALEMRQQEEAAREEAMKKADPRALEIMKRGDDYIRKIRACNEAIPGAEMTEKISQMEMTVNLIFQRAQEHPEIIPDLKKLMDYYLPMTVKLLNAYIDMDAQAVQGSNILNAKQEIEKSLDTLNVAFSRLLNDIFQDLAWDVSSDISVLHTLLAQEGLAESEFDRMKNSGAAQAEEKTEKEEKPQGIMLEL